MPKIFNSNEFAFGSSPFNIEPYGLLTVLPNLCTEAQSKHLVFDIRKLPSGAYSFPYHYHRNAEEVMYIISGSMTLRTNNEFHIVKNGDVLFFEAGENGAHQFFNYTAEPCTYFDLKTFYEMDVVVYPDSGKIKISKYNEVFKEEDQTDYFENEMDVKKHWQIFSGQHESA
jgi:uncharacterized cupin superfamily protein